MVTDVWTIKDDKFCFRHSANNFRLKVLSMICRIILRQMIYNLIFQRVLGIHIVIIWPTKFLESLLTNRYYLYWRKIVVRDHLQAFRVSVCKTHLRSKRSNIFVRIPFNCCLYSGFCMLWLWSKPILTCSSSFSVKRVAVFLAEILFRFF